MEKKSFGYFCLINTILLFSTYEVVSKTLVGKISPYQINFIRFFIGGLILFMFLLYKGQFRIKRGDLIWVLVVGIVNVVFSMNLLQLSLYINDTKASVVAVIFSSNPVFVVLFTALIDKEKLKLYKIIGLMLGLMGIITISFEKMGNGFAGFKGSLLAFSSAVLYGLYTVLGRRVSLKIGSLKMNAYSFMMGSLVLLPVLVLLKSPVLTFDMSGIVQILYLSFFVTGLAYLTYFKGLSIVGAGSGSLVFFIKPVIASMIAVIFLHENLSVYLFAGAAMTVSGVITVLFWPDLYKRFVTGKKSL